MQRPTLVVDASVVVKWVLPEEGHPEAVRIQEMYQDEEVDLIAPYLVIAEVANVLWKCERRGDLTSYRAQICFQELIRNCPLLMDSATVSAAALALALAHNRPFYDCLYLAWALEQGCDLITADEKFLHAMALAFPCIRLLKTFRL